MNGLTGKRVLVTRPREQSQTFVDRLVESGAQPIIFPTIQIVPLEDPSELDRAISQLAVYTWVIFSSVNGVAAFWQRMIAMGKDRTAFRNVQVAAIGPATAKALAERGVVPSFMPGEFVSEALLTGLGDVSGQRILLPRAEVTRQVLMDGLADLGAFPHEIAVYRTLPAPLDPQALCELEAGVDIATFTSTSTVKNYLALLGERAIPLLKTAVIACIGPITAETARACGLAVNVVAAEYTVDGLVQALLKLNDGEQNEN